MFVRTKFPITQETTPVQRTGRGILLLPSHWMLGMVVTSNKLIRVLYGSCNLPESSPLKNHYSSRRVSVRSPHPTYARLCIGHRLESVMSVAFQGRQRTTNGLKPIAGFQSLTLLHEVREHFAQKKRPLRRAASSLNSLCYLLKLQ
jgi:hypothetical protein